MYRFFEIFYSLKFKYIIIVITAITVFAISCNFVIRKLSDEAFYNAGEYAVGNLGSVSVNIDEVLKNVEYVFTPLITNPEFIDLAQDIRFMNPVVNYDDFEKMNKLKDILYKSYISNNYINSIYLYNFDNDIVVSGRVALQRVIDSPAKSTRWYANYEKTTNGTLWTVCNAFGSNEKILSSYRNIKKVNSSKIIGMVSINISNSIISGTLSKINFKGVGYAFVNDSLGNTLITSKAEVNPREIREAAKTIGQDRQEGYFKTALYGRPCLLAYHLSDKSGLKYIAVIPMEAINTFNPIVTQYIIYIFIALISMLALMAIITYTGFYRPVEKLFEGMHCLESGDFSVRMESGRRGEIGYIYENFNNMVKNLRLLIDENYIIQLNKKDAQLKMVLSQINEHFLYNTLDCIHWLARKHNVREISDIIFSLSKFYSLSLSNGNDVIRIKEIAAIIDSYMHIQNMRKPDCFEYFCDVESSLVEVSALKYLFQPLVENAVIHGVENKTEKGKIEVSFKQNGTLLHFEVSDDGVGISESKLFELRKSLTDKAGNSDIAFALTNINTQIKLFYGEEYGLSIESIVGCGTRVWIEIPLILKGDEYAKADDNR